MNGRTGSDVLACSADLRSYRVIEAHRAVCPFFFPGRRRHTRCGGDWSSDVCSSDLGYWPAFWMLGDAFRGNYLNWPRIGEIDIMENINGRPTAFSTLHCGVAPGGPCNEFNGIGKSIDAATLQDSFHTYAIELDKSIEPNQLRFYLDD